jgi:hypothetical protein
MVEKLDIKKIKIQTQRTILEDGLLEIMMGIYFILSGIYLTNKSLIINYLWLPLALVLVEVIRRRYVYPRTGYARLSLSTRDIVGVLLGVIGSIALLTGIIALIAVGNWRGSLPYSLAIVTTIFFWVIAYRFKSLRWYLHGILIGSVILINQVIKIPALVFGLGVLMHRIVGIHQFPSQIPPRVRQVS